MTFHQTLGSETRAAVMLPASGANAKSNVPLTVLEGILEDVKKALAHDPGAAQAGIARLSAILEGKETADTAPVYSPGGFAPWQKRRVETYLAQNLEQSVRIKTLADIVSLSASHFCRAFKQSFGKTPHRFLTGLRVERAKELMMSSGESLSQIALACGLADQAHLCKIFRRCVGQTPSVWRRVHAAA
jgi:AraC-like DNA-binding protein